MNHCAKKTVGVSVCTAEMWLTGLCSVWEEMSGVFCQFGNYGSSPETLLFQNDLLFLKVTSQLHHLSIKCAIHVLHVNKFNPHCLHRRPADEVRAGQYLSRSPWARTPVRLGVRKRERRYHEVATFQITVLGILSFATTPWCPKHCMIYTLCPTAAIRPPSFHLYLGRHMLWVRVFQSHHND